MGTAAAIGDPTATSDEMGGASSLGLPPRLAEGIEAGVTPHAEAAREAPGRGRRRRQHSSGRYRRATSTKEHDGIEALRISPGRVGSPVRMDRARARRPLMGSVSAPQHPRASSALTGNHVWPADPLRPDPAPNPCADQPAPHRHRNLIHPFPPCRYEQHVQG
jgi:hypothetical protein